MKSPRSGPRPKTPAPPTAPNARPVLRATRAGSLATLDAARPNVVEPHQAALARYPLVVEELHALLEYDLAAGEGSAARTSGGMSRSFFSAIRQFWRSLSARSSSRSFEKRDFAYESPRGNSICRMVDAAEIAYLTAFLASDKAWAVSGELVVATGGAGRSVYY